MTSTEMKRFEARKIRFLGHNAYLAKIAFAPKRYILATEAAICILVTRCYRDKIYSPKTVAGDIERSLMNTWRRMKKNARPKN